GIDVRGPGAASTKLARAQAPTKASPQLTMLRRIRSRLALQSFARAIFGASERREEWRLAFEPQPRAVPLLPARVAGAAATPRSEGEANDCSSRRGDAASRDRPPPAGRPDGRARRHPG